MFKQPIFARFEGSNVCEAEGLRVVTNAAGLSMCRKLIDTGFDAERPLHIYRGSQLAMKISSIGWGAQYTVSEEPEVHLVKYRPPARLRP